MQETQKKIIEAYLDACNRFDTEALVANIDDKLFFQNISEGVATIEVDSKAAFIEQAEMTTTFFQERTITPINWDFQGDTVTVEVDYKAILAVAFSETLQPGDKFDVVATMVFGFSGDKIVKLTYQM